MKIVKYVKYVKYVKAILICDICSSHFADSDQEAELLRRRRAKVATPTALEGGPGTCSDPAFESRNSRWAPIGLFADAGEGWKA